MVIKVNRKFLQSFVTKLLPSFVTKSCKIPTGNVAHHTIFRLYFKYNYKFYKNINNIIDNFIGS